MNPDNTDPSNAPSTDTAIIGINLNDNDLLTLVHRPITDSEAYWEKTFGLQKVRQDNMNLWLPNHWKNKSVYDYQEDYLYQDPRIFVSVETICAVVNARIPQPEVMPAQDNTISKQLADDLQKVLYTHSDKYRFQDIARIATRNLLLKRVGYVKQRFDPSVGDDGEIIPEHVAPEDIVVDQDARWGETPRFMAQKLRNRTGEELLTLFKDNQNPVLTMMGVGYSNTGSRKQPTPEQLGKKFTIWEVWFRYYDSDTQKYGGGLAWVDNKFQVVLNKMRNPNWNYEDEYAKGECANFLDYPMPPYFPINYLNDGSSYIDLTSLVEQAAPLQRILDRRGFQIMENAEMTGSGLIFNTQMISKEDVGKLIGAPDERIGVKGNVNQAMLRIPTPQLPTYVVQDKEDARSEIADIFSTHDVTRGQESGAKTLGQDMLQQNQDTTRMDDIARGVERMTTSYYRYLVQMMKVYYKEEHWFKATGEDGQYDFIMMSHDKIEDGIDIKVESGSTLPVNKQSQIKFVTDLTQVGLVDPLTLYEVGAGGTLPLPKKMLERLLMFKTDPVGFMGKSKDDDFDREAFMDIQILNAGSMPKERPEISPEYLAFFNNYIVTGTYQNQTTPIVKALFGEWLTLVRNQAARQLQAMATQQPEQQPGVPGAAPGQPQPGTPPQPGGEPGQPQQPPAPGGPPQGVPPPAPGMPPGQAPPNAPAGSAVAAGGAVNPAVIKALAMRHQQAPSVPLTH